MAVDEQIRTADVRGVQVAYWNPLRKTSEWGRRSLRARRVDNFGDLLGPLLVEKMAAVRGVPEADRSARRLFAVGSILQFAASGDVVWGAGINGKVDHDSYQFDQLDVRSTRGPLSAELLTSRFGLTVGQVFGDPALLLPRLFPEVIEWSGVKQHEVTVIPNLNDLRFAERDPSVVSPRQEVWSVIRRVAQSRLVVGSSLHAIIVAEALGVPARPVLSERESTFKYEDYYLGTGRDPGGVFARSVSEAIARGGVEPANSSTDASMAAFPQDLWGLTAPARPAAGVQTQSLAD